MFSNSRLCIRVILLFWFAVSSWAIMITSPAEGAVWSSTGEHTVSWIEVDTDPTTFAISLVQLGVFKQILVPSADGTKGSVTFSATLPTGSGFQVNIIKSAQDPNTILAQSPQITITSSGTPTSSIASSSSSSSSTSSLFNSSTASPAITESASTSKSSNGNPGSSSGFSSIAPNSPTLPGTTPSESVSGSSFGNVPLSSTILTSPTPSVTSPATPSNGSDNSGATTSLVSLEPTQSNEATTPFIVRATSIYFALFLSSIWTLL